MEPFIGTIIFIVGVACGFALGMYGGIGDMIGTALEETGEEYENDIHRHIE